MNHIIMKQHMDIQMKNGLDSFGIQQKLSDQYWSYFIPLFDEIFDELTHENEVLSINKIEIDLGEILLEEILKINEKPELLRKTKQQIIEQITKEISGTNTIVSSLPENHFHQWMFYMKNGYLNWNVASMEDIVFQHVLEVLAMDGSKVEIFAHEVLKKSEFLSRLIFQHSEDFLKNLLIMIAPDIKSQIINQIDSFKEFAENQLLSESEKLNAIQSFYREFIYNVVKLSSNGFDESIVFTLENLEAMSFEVKDYNSDTNENILSDSQIAEDNNPIYANNVGLVLVHPFISTLFKNLELVQNHEFVNKKAREKAVYLLYYAVSGLQNPKEYELVVPKILCGFPIHSVISNQVFLSPNELSEIDDMLKGMIANWEILNNTSIEGLRDGFLKRKGKINIHADKIKILVEKGSIDMLLDYLPWNLSHIKLPWFKHIIQVEWR